MSAPAAIFIAHRGGAAAKSKHGVT